MTVIAKRRFWVFKWRRMGPLEKKTSLISRADAVSGGSVSNCRERKEGFPARSRLSDMVFMPSIGAFSNLGMSAEEAVMLHNKINLSRGAPPISDWSTNQESGRGSNDFSSAGNGGAFPALSALQAIAGHGAGLPSTASGVQASSAMDLLNFAIKAMEANNNARLLPLAANSQAFDSGSSPSPILPDLAGCIADITSRISPAPAPLASSMVKPIAQCRHENLMESESDETSSRCGHSDSIRVSNLLNSSEIETPSSPSCVVEGADPATFGSVCAGSTTSDAVASSQAASPTPRLSCTSAPSLSSQISAMRKGAQSRYWSDEEHLRFLEGVRQCGAHDHKGIAVFVKTRSAAQVRSHGQKFFKKLNQHKGDGLPSMTRRKPCAESVIDTSG
jgi:SHAQKYF class myb-like DNA-binding protein